MKKYLSLIFAILALYGNTLAQNVTILPSGITPAMSGTYPRLSYDAIVALPSPTIGDIAYDTTFSCLRVYNGSKWVCTYQNPADPSPNMIAISTAGGTIDDYVNAIMVDASGNVYITGYFIGTVTFGATTKTSAGNYDVFVAKYNSTGTLQWVQSAGGVNNDFGNSIAVDASGNVYITGSFRGTATFGATTKTSVNVSNDIFWAKYSSTGILEWVQSAGGSDIDGGYGIAIDASGYIYITGIFSGTAIFGGTPKTSAGNYDIFVAKYTSTGTLEWVQSAGSTSDDAGMSIAIDASGYVYITGYFSGTANFGGTTKTVAGLQDIFIAKYGNTGSLEWVKSAGSVNYDVGRGIAVDANGNVYITGSFKGAATFENITKTSVNNSDDSFVAKYSSTGTVQWVQSAGGASFDDGSGIAMDANGNVYVIGYFNETAMFGATTKISAGSQDVFVAKYSSTGTLQWVQAAGGTGFDSGKSIAVNASGNIYATGRFSDTATFGATTKTSAGSQDIFVARLQQ